MVHAKMQKFLILLVAIVTVGHVIPSARCDVLVTSLPTSQCLLPVVRGGSRCRSDGGEIRWFYNSKLGACDTFLYSGCDGNRNNFPTQQACEETCGAPAAQPQAAGGFVGVQPVEGGIGVVLQGDAGVEEEEEIEGSGDAGDVMFGTDAPSPTTRDMPTPTPRDVVALQTDNGTPEPTVVAMTRSRASVTPTPRPAACEKLPDPGPCRSLFFMWYYDPVADDCTTFQFGGCGGNENRFVTRGDCLMRCKGMIPEVAVENVSARFQGTTQENHIASSSTDMPSSSDSPRKQAVTNIPLDQSTVLVTAEPDVQRNDGDDGFQAAEEEEQLQQESMPQEQQETEYPEQQSDPSPTLVPSISESVAISGEDTDINYSAEQEAVELDVKESDLEEHVEAEAEETEDEVFDGIDENVLRDWEEEIESDARGNGFRGTTPDPRNNLNKKLVPFQMPMLHPFFRRPFKYAGGPMNSRSFRRRVMPTLTSIATSVLSKNFINSRNTMFPTSSILRQPPRENGNPKIALLQVFMHSDNHEQPPQERRAMSPSNRRERPHREYNDGRAKQAEEYHQHEHFSYEDMLKCKYQKNRQGRRDGMRESRKDIPPPRDFPDRRGYSPVFHPPRGFVPDSFPRSHQYPPSMSYNSYRQPALPPPPQPWGVSPVRPPPPPPPFPGINRHPPTPLSTPPVCSQPLDLGICSRDLPTGRGEISWFYNIHTNKCEMFYFGGCGGNSNRFTDYRQCYTICADLDESRDQIERIETIGDEYVEPTDDTPTDLQVGDAGSGRPAGVEPTDLRDVDASPEGVSPDIAPDEPEYDVQQAGDLRTSEGNRDVDEDRAGYENERDVYNRADMSRAEYEVERRLIEDAMASIPEQDVDQLQDKSDQLLDQVAQVDVVETEEAEANDEKRIEGETVMIAEPVKEIKLLDNTHTGSDVTTEDALHQTSPETQLYEKASSVQVSDLYSRHEWDFLMILAIVCVTGLSIVMFFSIICMKTCRKKDKKTEKKEKIMEAVIKSTMTTDLPKVAYTIQPATAEV